MEIYNQYKEVPLRWALQGCIISWQMGNIWNAWSLTTMVPNTVLCVLTWIHFLPPTKIIPNILYVLQFPILSFPPFPLQVDDLISYFTER